MEYYAFTQGKGGARTLHPLDERVDLHIKNPDADYYRSIFIYKQSHYEQWLRSRSLAGIADVDTNRLVWDFDDESAPERARTDAKELVSRLIGRGLEPDAIQIAFSGKKGFSIEVTGDRRFTPAEVKNINRALADGLETNDNSICDAQRIFRVEGTRHEESGLYKIPLTLEQLYEVPVDEIKTMAKEPQEPRDWVSAVIPEGVAKLGRAEQAARVNKLADVAELDFRNKPKGFTNCKFAIMNGFFEKGHRSDALMALMATCRAQGFPKETAYSMGKAAIRAQARRYGTEPFPRQELWNNVVNTVYGSTWTGAQYTCRNQDFLAGICASLGPHRCKYEEEGPGYFSATDMSLDFEHYSADIEQNTIKTGIPQLDDRVKLTIGMPVGLLGAPSSGKTSLSLNILNNTSLAGIPSFFFSMDMYGPLVYLKMIQKLTGLDQDAAHDKFANDPKWWGTIKEKLAQEYKNVRFATKSGLTVADMRQAVIENQERTGEKIKLALIDYLELITGPYSDPTANTARVAAELKDFATEMGICVVTLVQPPKSAGDASAPLLTMRNVKGASMLEQSFRVILGVYREGFGPNEPENDQFMTINALKNTMGKLFSIDMGWDGVRGSIYELDAVQRQDLNALRKKLEQKKIQRKDDIFG